MAAVLAKLHTLRKEHAEAPKDTKDSLTRVESALAEVVERMTKLELMLRPKDAFQPVSYDLKSRLMTW